MDGYKLAFVIIAFTTPIITCASIEKSTEKPMPYEYEYKVEDSEKLVYYGAKESGNEAGRVEGYYYVLQPDGRLRKISYYVDGDSGFVPMISFQENANPFTSATKKSD